MASTSETTAGDRDRDADLAELEALMLRLVTGKQFERLGAIAHEHLFATGHKHLGRITLEAARAFDLEPRLYLGWCAACELLHNASLIHDDIEDRSRYRRGSYSVWVRHGVPQAINAGDLLLMIPYLAIDQIDVEPALRWTLARTLAERAAETVRGQSLEMTLFTSNRWSGRDYEEAVRGKTSAAFVLPVHGSALLAGHEPPRAEALGARFSTLGLLFQLRHDLLDLFGDQQRALRGVYLREGRMTSLVVEHLTRSPREVEWLGPILGKDPDETSDGEVERIAKSFVAAGVPRAVLERAEALHQTIVDDALLAETPGLHALARRLAGDALDGARRAVASAR